VQIAEIYKLQRMYLDAKCRHIYYLFIILPDDENKI